ncbi:hypothetical protein [Planctomicrobium piriforme]|uniref:Uncharacterized protein n=1 Tax=Planctomicrobium piriforme TaxID=1576369 RepID=A0A1I3PZT5_9PLAN|nr:hypothetical protein [Planctomicrobium piriforme]SFJ26872.1 hypothetical protein SAMN05421753_11787 [Planctomicrobium piriforme]
MLHVNRLSTSPPPLESQRREIRLVGGSMNGLRQTIPNGWDNVGMLSPTLVPGITLAEDYQQSPLISDVFVMVWSDCITLHSALEQG